MALDTVESRQEEIEELYIEWFPEKQEKPAVIYGGVTALDDQKLIEKALAASNGDKFQRLYNGDTSGYESQSEADLAFCNSLAFYSNRDQAQMDRIFRSSRLMREKWDKVHNGAGDTYGQMTIQKAIDKCINTYQMNPQRFSSDNYPQEEKVVPSSFSSEEVIKALHSNQDGDARLLKASYKDIMCFDHAAQRWYRRTDGNHWQEDRIRAAMSSINSVVKIYSIEQKRQNNRRLNLAKQDNANSDEIANTEKRINVLLKRINALQARKRKEDVLYLAAAGDNSLGISGEQWDADPWLLGVKNGIIDLQTGKLKPVDPLAYIKTVSPTEYLGIDTPAPTWEKFISEIFNHDPSLVDFIQRLTGYAMIGEATEDIFPVFWGEDGRNGKDTFFEALLYTLGKYASPIESELLLAQRFKKRAGTASPEITALRGKRIIWASETEEGRRFDVSKIKYLTGGGSLTGRDLYSRHMITFEPSHTLFLITNPKPKAKGHDAAFWERVFLIPMTQRFVENPQGPEEHQADINMLQKLQLEVSGILAWLVRGCLKWQKEGLKPPEIVKQATDKYKYEQDQIARFIDECCELGNMAEVRAKKLYDVYILWAEKSGERPESIKDFGPKIKKQFDSYKDRKGIIYTGVKLNEENDEEKVTDF
jgi:putative DNA primase/helicase